LKPVLRKAGAVISEVRKKFSMSGDSVHWRTLINCCLTADAAVTPSVRATGGAR